MPEHDNITGRDGYIFAQALYVTAKALRSQEFPEHSNADDMEAIAHARFPSSFEQQRLMDRVSEGVRMGLGLPPQGMALDAETIEAWIAHGGRRDG